MNLLMKIAFVLVSVLCALTLACLTYIYTTDKIPFKAPPPVPAPVAPTEIMSKNMNVPSDERAKIAELIESLKAEKELWQKKRAELDAEKQKDNLDVKIAVLQKLTNDLAKIQGGLEGDIRGMKDAEKKNLQSIAEVYGKMEPANAAAILKEMDKKRAAMVISLMENRPAAAILDEVSLLGADGKKTAVEWADIIRKMKGEEATKKGTSQP